MKIAASGKELMDLDDFEPISYYTLNRTKHRAFEANDRAKRTTGAARDAHYRAKDNAINSLLTAGFAFVDSVDWRSSDPTIGVTFTDGGRLHTKLSSLDRGAFRRLRRQLNGDLTPTQNPTTGGRPNSVACM